MSIKNLLLRGSRLKNGSWAVGIVVSTGKDTKIMKNANQGTNKLTSVDDRLNKYMILVFMVQLMLCVIVSELLRQECNSQFNLSEYLTD